MTNDSTVSISSTSYLNATGPIRFGMTNDYMFRAVLQENNYVLKGLICALLRLRLNDVISVEITNPIELGKAPADDKEFILDIKVSLNNQAIINLEMQMTYREDWRERSLSYLCRSFDQLQHGAEYGEIKPTMHIGFLNFAPNNNEKPEFYASYQLMNEKTYAPYSDKLILRVVNLKQIDMATDEDKAIHLDYWARLFTAKSWEEVIMITKSNSVLSSASQSLYKMNANDIIREKCLAREDYLKTERAAQKFGKQVKILQQELSEKDAAIAEKDATIAEKDNYIKILEAQLGKTKKNNGSKINVEVMIFRPQHFL